MAASVVRGFSRLFQGKALIRRLPVVSSVRHLRRLPVSELEEEMKPLKLQPELASYAGSVLYPDEESAKWDVDGMSP